jgi:uncharacterized protein YqeY
MLLTQKIAEDLKTTMKLKDEVRLSCLRMLKTALKNRQIEKGSELKDDEIQSVISSLIKKGTEASTEFRRAGRGDLADKEDREIKILYEYLPEQLSHDEIEKILLETIKELSAESQKNLGKVMKIAMARMAGKAQGREVNDIARRLLSNPA